MSTQFPDQADRSRLCISCGGLLALAEPEHPEADRATDHRAEPQRGTGDEDVFAVFANGYLHLQRRRRARQLGRGAGTVAAVTAVLGAALVLSSARPAIA